MHNQLSIRALNTIDVLSLVVILVVVSLLVLIL